MLNSDSIVAYADVPPPLFDCSHANSADVDPGDPRMSRSPDPNAENH
jgi:hypothetical protein